jgi:dynein heavy chain, axonemal
MFSLSFFCSFVSYLGPFNRAFRNDLLAAVAASCAALGVPATPDLQVSLFLAEETEIGQWGVEGLPSDDLSVQNGILVTRAVRPPLLIDPQGQGRAWLLKREEAAGLRVARLADKNFRTVLEACLSGGKRCFPPLPFLLMLFD